MRWLPVLGVVILLMLWTICTALGWIGPLFLPSPTAVATKLVTLFGSRPIWADIGATMGRIAVGFLGGTVIGIIVGAVLGASRRLYALLEFVVDFSRSIPVACLFPLFLVIFGIGNTSKVATAIWSVSLIVLLNTMYGVRHGREARVLAARTMGATKMQIFWKIMLPDALPETLVGMRNGLSIAFIVIVLTEMFLGTSSGLGRRIYNAGLIYDTAEMYAAILLAGTLGYMANKAFVGVESRIVHWAGK